jgi:hypothetical protein
MSWGVFGPLTFRVGKNGGKVTVFGAWFVALPLVSMLLSSGSPPPEEATHELLENGDWKG